LICRPAKRQAGPDSAETLSIDVGTMQR